MVDLSCKALVMESSHRAEAAEIARELAKIARSGQVLPGSIGERRLTCGRPNCACHQVAGKLHGPYFHWTRKVAKKTVGKYLSAERAHEYSQWIDNDRRLRELVSRLEALGVAALEAENPGARA